MIIRSCHFSYKMHKQAIQHFTQYYARYLSNLPSFSAKHNNFLTNLTFNNVKQTNRRFHINNVLNFKLRVETENSHVYKIMQSIPLYENNLSSSLSKVLEKEIVNQKDYETQLAKHWRSESASDIVKMFKKLCHYSKLYNISLSDTCFDNLVDGLMDKCQDMTDEELTELLYCINQYPKSETITSHNFHDIWSALDDICCKRIHSWSTQKTLLFSDLWYLLGLAKYCDYSVLAIKRLCRKIKSLTPTELVQTLFYINICRKQWSMFDFECRLEECINELSLSELAVVSLAFFKTETAIKETFILSQIVSKLLEETTTIHEISLSALLKVIRYSPHIPLVDQLNVLLTKLVPEIDRLSIVSCLHIALVGTNTQFLHQESLTKISEKFVKHISETRLKDLERLIFVLTLLNFDPKIEPNIFEVVLPEIRKPERKHEIEKYPRCFPCCIHYLGLQEIYPYDLIDKVLNPGFISNAYGNNKRSIGREILFINSSLDIDCPDYKGNRLDPKLQKSLAKWTSDWIPTRNQKQRLTAADKLMLDIIDVLEIIHGRDNFIHIDYILPHFPKADIIICKDNNGNPVEVKKYYEHYKLGEIMKPELNDGLTWYAIVVGSWNMFIRGTSNPVGTLATKLRQLKKIGYVPVVVPWSEFLQLSKHQREKYLLNKIT